MNPCRILLVEDEQQTAQVVQFYLQEEGFTVAVAADGPSGDTAFQQDAPDLVLLDIMLTGYNGLDLCRRIRQGSNVPILMLTARAADEDKATGLGVGADDYLTKPFSPTELIARVQALLRRAYEYNEPIRPQVYGGPRLLLDCDRHTVTLDGSPLDVTPIEFRLLHALMANPGWAFTRDHLLEDVWGYSDGTGDDIVTVHVSNLRNRLGPDGARLIRTVRGVGYTYLED